MPDELENGPSVYRRSILKAAGAAGVLATGTWGTGTVAAVTGDTPLAVTDHKWVDPLPRPGVMLPVSHKGGVPRYELELSQFPQPVLPTSMGLTTEVWGYAGSYPAPTIEARPGKAIDVEYVNNLPDQHLLSVDDRIHGAGDGAPAVRTVAHLHGGVVRPEDDGYPEAWVDPSGRTADHEDFPDVPSSAVPYKAVKHYPNEQKPGTLWYHDHALGITRLNVYAGLAGFYLLRDPMEHALPSGAYEVPILLQDRSFTETGALAYPAGDDDVYEAEFAGDVPVVNGKVYPYLAVEPRSYRFRFLNGSNNRAFDVRLHNETTDSDADVPLFRQIGVDLGFLETVVDVGPGGTIGPRGTIESLLLSGAERADVVVDFSGFENTTFVVRNDAEFPYAGEGSGPDIPSMGELLQIRVMDGATEPDETIPLQRFLDQVTKRYEEPAATPSGITRTFTLDSAVVPVDGGIEYDSHFLDLSLWDDEAAVVTPTLDTSEVWELVNATGDSHPIHLHLVDFEVLEREAFTWDDMAGYENAAAAHLLDPEANPGPAIDDYVTYSGETELPNPNNRLHKDTVLVDPLEVVRIRPDFTGFTGRFPWHCHILEHEDQEMMLSFEVVP